MSYDRPARHVIRATTLAAALCCTAGAARAQTTPLGVTPFVGTEPTARTLFTTAAQAAGAPVTNVIDFQDVSLPVAGTTGLTDTTYTRLGFVKFVTTPNYSQEIIDGFNVGQPNNNVYTTAAYDKSGTIADVTFGAGVRALGFDLKNTASGGGTSQLVPQPFMLSLFSGATSLGSFPVASLVGGTSFTFAGFLSTLPITELRISSVGGVPNLDVVLDNFALSNQAPVTSTPEPASLALVGAGLLGAGVLAGRRRATA